MENITKILSQMKDELGISIGTAIIILISLYFIIKWAVKNGVKQAYVDITGEEINNLKKVSNIKTSTEKNNNKHIEE